ncbi:MAG: sterol desaturase family protein [Nevskia sp.]|nr:sterol desaturase family protein [Nevskia sp.]
MQRDDHRTVDNRVEAFRERYRREQIGPRYNGLAHLCFTSLSCLAVIAFCASRLQAVQWWEWLTVPTTFFFANLVEHAGHRGPMHHPRKGLRLVYERHSGQHHRFFTPQRMDLESTRDFKAVLFPPVLLLFFFGCFALPVGIPLALLTTANIGYLFALTSFGYFLNYEWLHFAYHTPEDSWIARLPGVRVLRRHHTLHHDQNLMSHYNFNITYPIADWLRGTLYRPGVRVADEGENRAQG